MDNQFGSIEALIDKAESLGKTSFELYKLKIIDKSSGVFSSLVARVAVVAVALIGVILLSIAVSLWLGEQLGNLAWGFLVTGAFYALATIVVFVFREAWVKKPVNNSMIRAAMN